MKIDYPYVFRDGGGTLDSEKNARLLTSAFVRFLLSAGSAYFTFYNDGERVDLSDDEKQILESGLRDLSVTTMTTQLIFEAGLSANLSVATGTAVVFPFVPSLSDPTYATWDGGTYRLYFPYAGLYQVILSAVPFGTPADVINQSVQIRVNGTPQALAFNRRMQPSESLLATKVLQIGAGGYLDFRYVNQGTGAVTVASTTAGTFVQVMRHG